MVPTTFEANQGSLSPSSEDYLKAVYEVELREGSASFYTATPFGTV